jgi:ribosomal subunit interface protein
MTKLSTLPWNLVTKNLHGHQMLRKQIRDKIAKLEKHLVHFPDDTVHLQIVLERHPSKGFHTATLTLRLPSNILHTQKTADDVITAFDDAVVALLRELESLKADLRGERFWKRKERRKELRELEAAGFAPEPMDEGAGPQKHEEVVRDLFQQHYKELLRHARRQIHQDELAGEIPEGALDPRDVVNEVAGKAMTHTEERPERMGWLLWFYHLIHEELKRQRRLLKQGKGEQVSTDEIKPLPEDAERAAGYDAERPLDIIEEKLEPPVVRTESLVPDPSAVPPDEIVAVKDAFARLQQDMRSWPRAEREVFELYYIEGFEPEEIAMVTGQPVREVQKHIDAIHARLRAEILEQEAVT